MKTIKLAFLATTMFVSMTISAQQKRATTYLEASYALESNIGFHGFLVGLEKQLKIGKSLSFVPSVHYFTSNSIPDRRVGEPFNRSVLLDMGLQYKFGQSHTNGFALTLGSTMRFSNIKSTSSYSITDNVPPSNITYNYTRDAAVGFKVGLAYQFWLSSKLSSAVFLDARFIDIITEPTFLNLGYKIGF